MGHSPEPGMAKVKLAHYFDDGNKIEFEAHVEAEDYTAAVSAAESMFTSAIADLQKNGAPSMRKVKIEM